MKNILGVTVLIFIALGSQAQFYYKDLVTIQQTNAQWGLLKNNRVKAVKLESFEANNQPSEGFSVQQRIVDNRMITQTQTPSNGSSQLTATYNTAGRLAQTVDTSEDFHGTTNYEYDADGRVTTITNVSRSNEFTTTEVHAWSYDASGKPSQMLRIRNNTDTTYITFGFDGKKRSCGRARCSQGRKRT
jgi:YD repeat-containing protein